jgi:hypothetical protein
MAKQSENLPPHSDEAERGVLGCVLLAPASCLSEAAVLTPECFYDIRHRIIFSVMLALGDKLDSITLIARLKRQKKIEEAGGVAYLSELPDKVPSAANLEYYIKIVREKFLLRKIAQVCSEVANRVVDYRGEMDELLFGVNSDLASIADLQRSKSTLIWTPRNLMDFDFSHDETCLLGIKNGKTTGYLCRGQGAWVIGPSGIGKSSITLQQAVLWALGRDFCGLMPVRPLRVLYIQAENSQGDQAEQLQGILNGLGISSSGFDDAFDLLDQNLRIVQENTKIGLEFCTWLEMEIREWRADLVIVDPFLSFAGIDVSRQEQCSKLLRQWLQPVLTRTGAAIIGAHHTGKPPKANEKKYPQTPMEIAYLGIGSSEIVNWARALSVLIPLGDGKFHLCLAKRAAKANSTNIDGSPSDGSIYLRHSASRIFWEQIVPPEIEKDVKPHKPSTADKVITMNTSNFLAGCQPDGEGFMQLARRLSNWLASEEANPRIPSLPIKGLGIRGAIDALVSVDKLDQRDGMYFKGKNA